jgi:hypothetical protein
MLTVIQALDDINNQVWAAVFVLCGAGLIALGQHDGGTLLIGGGLALLQHKES